MESAPTLSPAPDVISANLRMILRGLLAVLGMWRVEPVVAIALYRRISRTLGKIERMLVRFRAGKLRLVTQRDAASGHGGGVAGRGPALPRRFGWLVIAGGHQAAGFGCQLQTVLSTPEMAELLAASAQARRILRPLCRALALEVPGVSSAARVPRETKPRVKKTRVKPEPFRIPLPRGLLSAARRQGFGKMR